MNIHAIDWSTTPWEPVREGVERKAFSGEGATVSLNRLQPGHEPRPHDHPHEQIVYILSGQIDFLFVDLSVAIPQIEGGKIKALGVTSRERFALVPDIRTINESGAPGYDLVVWFALAGPARLPGEITRRVSTELNKALQSKKLQQAYAHHGLATRPTTPQECRAFIAEEIVTWGALIKLAGIEPQD